MPRRSIHSICVMCGSNDGRNPAYVKAATHLGECLARRRIKVVYGGAQVGLMGALADAALAAGGDVAGIITPDLAGRVGHHRLRLEHVTSMHERKRRFSELSDAYIALPGGFGTLDEFFEVLTWRQIGLHDKPIIVIDGDGYWEPLLDLLDHLVAQGFTSRRAREGVVGVRTITELFHALDRAPEPSSKTLLTPF